MGDCRENTFHGEKTNINENKKEKASMAHRNSLTIFIMAKTENSPNVHQHQNPSINCYIHMMKY